VLAGLIAWEYASSPELKARQDGPVGATFAPAMVTAKNLLTLGTSPGSEGGLSAIQFYVGIDGLNVWLVLLTALLMVSSVLISWNSIEERIPEFFAWLMVLQTGMTGLFLAFDIILFYVFFELTLVPLFFLIGIWGGSQRQYAARKFFIYTLAGSLFTLLGVLGLVLTLAQEGPDKVTFSIPQLVKQVNERTQNLIEDRDAARQRLEGAEKRGESAAEIDKAKVHLEDRQRALDFWRRVQFWAFLGMMCGFAIKVPLVPVHTWLPLAHTEAPTAGSVLLAGVLLKIGAYGFLRLCLPLTPDASLNFGVPVIGTLAVIGIIYGAFCALGQHDIKKLVAYSSVSHLGYCMLGMFALNEVGLSGSLLQMINHGLSTGALFLLVGMLYDRYHTRKIADYGGMGKRLPVLTVFFVFITLSSIGLPGLNGFVSETLCLMGMYQFGGSQVSGQLLTTVSCAGAVLGAWYMLTLVMRVFCGEVREPPHEGHAPAGDLNAREVCALAPIAIACLVLGMYPKPFLDTVGPDVKVVKAIVNQAR
jgi:NADH-quinone oxidoreductase subunit M